MKKFFSFVVFLFLFMSASAYANDNVNGFLEDDMWNEAANSRKAAEMLESLKDLCKDATPEEKAIYRKMMEDQMRSTLDLMELEYKKLENSVSPEEKKRMEDVYKAQKAHIERTFKETMKVMGL